MKHVSAPRGGRGPTNGRPKMAGRWRELLLPAGLIVAMVLVCYAPAVRAGFVWDDDVDILANPHLQDLGGLFKIWLQFGATRNYYPLFYTGFWVEHHLWGSNPLGYHLVNIGLHGACALLLWTFLRRLRLAGAWLAAAIFAVHPICVESVAWADELKNVQSGVLYLVCLLAYFRARPLFQDETAPRAPRTLYALALVSFGAALLTKPAAVFLPFVILLIVWWRSHRVSTGALAAIAPVLGMSVAIGLVTMYVEANYSGASGAAWQMPILDRLLVAGRALWFYVGTLVWPATLISIYPRWNVDSGVWVQYLYPVAAAIAVAALWAFRSKLGHGPLVAALCFAILIAPTLGIFNVGYHLYSFVADHFQYHAAPALFALFGAGIGSLTRRSAQGNLKPIINGGCAILLTVLIALSFQHALAFQSEKARCVDTLRKNPTAWLAMNNLGVALNAEGKPREAVEQYQNALRIRPIYAEAHSNMGVALVAQGKVAEAIPHYREALRIWPSYAAAHNNLGTALTLTGDLRAAIQQYRLAVRIRPDYAEAHNNLATVLASTGEAEEAVRHHMEALRLNPDYAQAQNDLGVTLMGAGRIGEAIERYQWALQVQPSDPRAHNNLGTAFAAQGNVSGAIQEFQEALRIKPDYAEAHNSLGLAYASLGHLQEAMASFEAAVRIKPDYAEAYNNLGTALASQGAFQQAILRYRDAVRVRPQYAEAHKNLGAALVSSGQIQDGLSHLKEALRIAPEYVEAHSLLGAILAEHGRIDEAITHFERAVALKPSDPRARADLERARQMRGR